jgi:gliding motility-associated-like protein
MLKNVFLVTGFMVSLVTFGQAPNASFSSVPASVGGTITLCQGSTITFNNTSNQTVAGTTYLWNFGLGATPATANTAGPHTVTYNTATAPTTTVTLTVTNPGFPSSLFTRTIDVNALPNAALTLASIGGGFGTITQGGQTIFKNCGAIDSALFSFNAAVNNTVTQVFNWGDGSTSTNLSMVGSQITHDYPLGQFTLIHSVTQNGCTNTASYIVFNGSAPQVTVSAIGSNTCLPSPYSIDILSNDVPITYTVNFSDGTPSSVFTTSNDTTINHIFNTSSCGIDYVYAPGLPPIPNAYSASIVAQNICSNNGIPTVITVGPIIISTGTTAEFSYTPQSAICVLEPVTFTNETVAGESVSQAGCDTTYGYYWEITPNTFTVNAGSLGSSNGFTGAAYNDTLWTNGSDNLEILFSQPGTYYVWLHTGNSCGPDSTLDSLVIKPEAHLTFSLLQQTVCSGDSTVEFTMTSDQPNYWINWDITDTTNISNITVLSGNGVTPVVFSALLPQNNTNETGVIQIEATVECSNDSADVHVITVNPQANAYIDPLFYELCNGETTDIEVTSNLDNVQFTWTAVFPNTITGAANGIGSNIAQTLNNSGNSIDSVQYYVTVQNAACPGDTAIVTVAVQPQLVINTNVDFTICPGTPVNPEDYISTPPGADISWTNNNTDVGLGASGTGNIPTFNAASNVSGNTITGTIDVEVQLGDCPAVQDQFLVNVLSAPGFDYTTTPQNGLDCVTGIGMINGVVDPLNTTASWSGPGIVSGGNTFNPVINQPGQYVVILNDNTNGCSSTYTVIIEPPTLINITQVNVTNVTCFNGSNGVVSIDTDNGNGSNLNYTWNPAQNNAASVNGLITGSYTVTVSNEDGCEDDTTVFVNQPGPILIVQIDSVGSECGEANGSLSVLASGGVGNFSYSWSSGNNQATANNIDAGTFTVTATDGNGCATSESFDLGCTPLIPIVIPQFLSPNGDNQNELWIIQNTAQYPSIKVTVYNRWGSVVYEAEPYNNDWNGHLKGTNPNPLPAATYFYVVDTNKKSQDPYQGYIEIQP